MIYPAWLALFLGLPLATLWIIWGSHLWRRRRALGWTLLGALVLGGTWDHLAVRAHIWYYAPSSLAGWWIAGLPIEEWLWISGTTLLFASLTILAWEKFERA